MAKVKLSALVDDINGKFNGSSFQNTRYGLQLNKKVNQVKRRTPPQSAVRQIFQNNARAWRSLTDNQRESWRINAPTPALGYNLFQSRNYIRRVEDLPILQSYVVGTPLPPLTPFVNLITPPPTFPVYRLEVGWFLPSGFNAADYSFVIWIVQSASPGAGLNQSAKTGLNQVSNISSGLVIEFDIFNRKQNSSSQNPAKWIAGNQLQAVINVYETSSGLLASKLQSGPLTIPS